ncbi:MAG: S41 family peptidase [Bacteroidota bacterium]
MKQLQVVLLILFFCFSTEIYPQQSKDSLVTKNIDIFSAVYRKVLDVYPYSVEPNKLALSGINPMLESLDPFSKFFNESQVLEMKQRLAAKFGGIGVILQETVQGVVVVKTLPDSPSEKAGISVADQIISIDGKLVKDISFDDVFGLLRGKPESEISLTIKRPSIPKEISFTLKRAIINLNPVTYAGMLNENIAYIRLAMESEGSAKELENALTALYKKYKFKGLIFDLRSNEGGYLSEAVKTANLFIDKGSLLVKTSTKERDTAYYAMKDPVFPIVPMVVLINNNTVSSGEILAGALQDNDRAVFIGQKTFGKGLIQEILDMPGKTQIMLTTGSYFTPCGRCIQAFNYRDGDKEMLELPKISFETKNGRKVYNGGGISPDIETLYSNPSKLKESLEQHNIIFDFATDYKLRNPSIPTVGKFRIDQEEYNRFIAFAKTRKIIYQTDTEVKLQAIKESATKEGLWETLKKDIELAEGNLATQKENDFIAHKTEVINALEEEIVSRYYKNGGTQSALLKDPEVKKAIELLMDTAAYNKILNIK